MMRTTNDVARRRRGRGGRAELQPPRAARLFSEVKFGPGGGVMPPRNRTMAATAVVMRSSSTVVGKDARRTRGVLGARVSPAQSGNRTPAGTKTMNVGLGFRVRGKGPCGGVPTSLTNLRFAPVPCVRKTNR